MFKYLCKNKKGFTLIEMIIAVTIVGSVISIAGQLLNNFSKTYNLATHRWEVQSAVHLACNKFENGKDSLINSQKADLIFDEAVEAGVIYNKDTKTITWKTESKVVPKEGEVLSGESPSTDAKDLYTYIFSAPTYDSETNQYLGEFLYIRPYDSGNSIAFLDDEGMGQVPIDISFRVATSLDRLEKKGQETNGETSANNNMYDMKEDQYYYYLTSTVEFDFKSGLDEINDYEIVTQLTVFNSKGKSLTMEGQYPVLEAKWGDTAYPAGWNHDTIYLDSNGVKVDSAIEGGKTLEVQGKPDSKVKVIQQRNPNVYGNIVDCSDHIYGDANMIRFISERAADSKGNVSELTTSVNMASCLTEFLFIDGTQEGARTVGALREFRDNVLKGTAVGDYIIDKYYNSWSPALIEVCKENPAAGKAIKAVLTPVSKVLGIAGCE